MGPQASGQPDDLLARVRRPPALAAGRPAFGIEAFRQVGDRLREALRDGRKMPLVAGDQRRVGLRGELVGKIKRAGGQRLHGIGCFARVIASSSSFAATVAPSVPIVPATAVARARISGGRAVLSAADRDPAGGGGPSWATPAPRSATPPGPYRWFALLGTPP